VLTPADRNTDLALALRHHQAGSFDAASDIYRRIHAANRHDSEVIFLMGLLCCDLGAYEPACRFLDEAIAITPNFPEARRQWVTALNGWADQKILADQAGEAKQLLDRALERIPGDALTLRNLGRVALMQGDAALAETRLTASLALPEHQAYAFNWLGLAQLQQAKFAEAEVSLRRALQLQPDLDQARNNLGLVLHRLGQFAQARVCFEEVLQRDPGCHNARINLALTLRIFGQPHAARGELETVLLDHPSEIDALSNLGVVFQDLGEPESAYARLTQALMLSPDSPSIRWNLSLTQLLLGDFERGWPNYEARWAGCDSVHGMYQLPEDRAWRGEALHGKRLLLWAEQGFGDTIQFMRFAQDMALQGAIVSVMAPPQLMRLVASAPGVCEVYSQDAPPPRYDFHCPLLSLPFRLGLPLDAHQLHGSTPYLSAPADRIAYWRERLSAHSGLKVGLVWAGNARRQSVELRAVDLRRSIALERWAPILAVSGCSFFSLQKDGAAAELRIADGDPASGHASRIHDFSPEWTDFADTAAFTANLDLVISVDTAVAHLAGALGKPVWLLNRHDTCWRWLLNRSDSPWYRSLRQFRQPALGQWDAVIEAATAALVEKAAGREVR
jgi:tetratricopeptide (TPR) repeat protein